MSHQLAETVPGFPVGGQDCSTGLEFLKCQTARTLILLSNILEGADDVCILTFGEKVFGRFLQPNHRDSQHAKDENQSSIAEPNISPALSQCLELIDAHYYKTMITMLFDRVQVAASVQMN